MQVKKQQLEPDMKQQTGSKLGKEYNKNIFHHSCCLTSMQSTSCKMLGWMKLKLDGIKFAGRNINNLRYADDTTLMAESKEGERGESQSWLKIQHSENSDHGIQSHHLMANR